MDIWTIGSVLSAGMTLGLCRRSKRDRDKSPVAEFFASILFIIIFWSLSWIGVVAWLCTIFTGELKKDYARIDEDNERYRKEKEVS